MNNILEMTGIRKEFPGVLALDDVSLYVEPGEVHILLGENGAGKSTLVKILAGAYERDQGEVIIEGRSLDKITPRVAQENGVSIIYQELNLVGPMTVAENIFLGREPMKNGRIYWKRLFSDTAEILSSLNLSLDPRAVVRELGVAEQQMVEIAKAFSQHAKIIVMDEPTAVLTESEIDNLFEIVCNLKKDGISIVYISHRLEEFKRIGDRITVMRDGKTITTVSAKDTAIPELIRLLVGRELKDQYPSIDKNIGDVVLEVKGLNQGKTLRDVNLEVRAGEILGIAGLVGSGRTEMARAIFGADPIDSGEIYINGRKVNINSPKKAIDSGLGFVTEDRKLLGLILPLSVAHNMTLANLGDYVHYGKIKLGNERKAALDYVNRMGVKTPSVDQKTVNLSGGNQQKVVLAKWMLSHSKVFIFDEPTRGIDVGAKAEVYGLMNELVREGAAIIMISSELPEILGMSDRVKVMCRGEFLGELPIEDATQEKILYFAAGGGKHFE
jgi:ribose transport system ATP-binding protein